MRRKPSHPSTVAPGCDEVVRDGDTRVLTKGDPTALAKAVIGLLLDPERRRAMARRARENAERLFDFRYRLEIYTPQHKRIYGYYVLPFLFDEQLAARCGRTLRLVAGRLAGA